MTDNSNAYSLDTLARAPKLFGEGIAPGALANFLPPAPDVAAKTSILPGIVTGNVSGLASMAELANAPLKAGENYVRDKLGLQPAPVIPKPQWLTDWSNAYEGSLDRATKLMPQSLQPDPQNYVEEAITRGGNAVGSMVGVPLPSKLVGALPKALQVPASFAAPLSGVTKPAIPLSIGAVAPLAVTEADRALLARPQRENSLNSETQPATNNDQWLFAPPKQAPTQQGNDQWLFKPPEQPTTTDAITQAEQEGGESGITGGGLVAGLGAAIAAGLAAKYHTRIPGFVRAIDRPGYLRDAQTFNDAAALRASGDPAQTFQMDRQPTAPLALSPADALLKKTQTYTQDRNATIAAHLDAVQQTDKDLSHALGIVNNDASQAMRISAIFETGVHKGTGISMPSWGKLSRDIDRLSPEDQQILHSGLWSRSALDNRLDLFNKAKQGGSVGSDPRAFRTGLYNTTDDQLRANVAAMENTPHINDIADRYRTTMLRNLDIAEAMGFPRDELAQIRKANPNYVPTVDSSGEIAHTFAARDTEPYLGNEIPNTTPWDAGSQHNEALYKLFETNAVKRRAVDASIDAQIKNPKLAKMFERKQDYAGNDVSAPNDTNAWTIYRPTGRETYTFGNREFADAFARNPTLTNANIGFMRRLYQKGVTGPLSLAFGGKFFPAINAARSVWYLPIHAPTGFASGHIDKAFQRATGYNLRTIIDQPIGMVGAGAADAGNRMMLGLANSLEPGAKNYGNQLLRHLSGDAQVDAWRQSMLQRYEASITHEMRARGAVGGLGYGQTEVPAYQTNVKGTNASNPAADMAPGLYRAKSPFTKAVMPYGVGMKKLVNEGFDIVSNMGHSHFYRLNRDNPNISPERLVRETRRLTGDMGTAGSGTVARYYNDVVPFANAATQDIAQMAHVFKERPVATPLAYIGNMSVLAAGSLLSALVATGGLHHLYDLMSTSQRATGPVYYTDPNDPTKYQQLSLPQNVRGLWPIIMDLMGHATHAWDARHDEGAFDRAYHTLSSLMSHHVSNYAATSAEHGLGQAVDPYTSVGPVGNAFANALGKQWDARPEDVISDLAHGRLPTVARDLESRANVPNQAGVGTSIESASRPAHLLSSVLGIAGNVAETYNRGVSAAQHGDSVIHAVLDNMGQHIKDQNSMFDNVLWKNEARISHSTPLIEATERRHRVLEETAPANTDIRFEGYTRRSGPATSGLGETKISHDPLIQRMYWEAKNYNLIVTKELKEVKDIRKLSADLANTRDSETVRRQKENEYTQQVDDRYYKVAQTMSRLNARLSQLAGKPIDIGDRSIDWSKGSEQFRN